MVTSSFGRFPEPEDEGSKGLPKPEFGFQAWQRTLGINRLVNEPLFLNEPKSIYELPYFESEAEAQYWLNLFADEKHPLILPEYRHIKEVQVKLNQLAETGNLTERQVLLSYQFLRESQKHTDVFCGWIDTSTGKKCGGKMYKEADALGVFYQCRLISTHRTPMP
jgi:hypothetical protein